MIIFPPEFKKTKYPGYFFNTKTKTLYSIKGGSLKELVARKVHEVSAFVRVRFDTKHSLMYQISVNGNRRHVFMEELLSLPDVAYDMIDSFPIQKPEYTEFKGGTQKLFDLYRVGVPVEWYDDEYERWYKVPFLKQQYSPNEYDSKGNAFRVSNKNYTFRVKTMDIPND